LAARIAASSLAVANRLRSQRETSLRPGSQRRERFHLRGARLRHDRLKAPVASAETRKTMASRQRGSSLVELMIGAALVFVALQSVTLTMVSQGNLRRTSEEQSLAMVACRNNLEAVRNLPLAELPALHGAGFDVPDLAGHPGVLQPLAGDEDGLPGQFLVTVDQTSAGETIYLVRMVVDWYGIGGKQQFELKSLVAARKGA
jgi:hypothetical protein